MTVYFTCILPLDITRKSYTITGREPYRRGRACLLLFDQLPARIRVVFGDGGGDCRSIRAEVFLIDPALVIDDESHHAGAAPLGGPRDQRVAGDHVAVDDVAESSSRSMRALAREDSKKVPVIRRTGLLRSIIASPGGRLGLPTRRVLSRCVTLRARVGHHSAQRTRLFVQGSVPVEAVVCAGRAQELLRVHGQPVFDSVLRFRVILP